MTLGKHSELESIISKRTLSSVFQPIYDLISPHIVGYEALIRGPANSEFHNPMNLFETANKSGLLSPLEFVCRDVSCEQFVQKQLPGKLFINISPMSLLESKHPNGVTSQILKSHGLSPDRVVIEISEQYPLDDYEVIRLATHHYRAMGFEIAIDDLGAGYSGLRVWSEIRPDYVKIDRHFIENIHEDPIKREFVRSIQEISRSLGCKVIAEGIETESQLSTVRSLGINLCQGFLLGRPKSSPSRTIPYCITSSLRAAPYKHGYRRTSAVMDMMDQITPVGPDVSLSEAADIFQKNIELSSIPVVEQGRPIGIILRRVILELFLGRYGRELYAKRPIRDFLYKNAIIVEHDCSLEEVSRLITDDPEMEMNVDFIIVKDSQYMGTGKIKKLLRKITEQQIRSARYSNPLTLLPGNVPIYEWVDNLLENQEEFYVAYFDINDFKPYNDKYGYSQGDEVIVRLGEILKIHSDMEYDMVGHIGGDDFVVIFRSMDWFARCQRILDEFKSSVREFYNDEDYQQGGINSIDRRGDQCFFPLISIAVGVVNPDPRRCFSHHNVAALASDAKKSAKKEGGNLIFVSRRQGHDDLVVPELERLSA